MSGSIHRRSTARRSLSGTSSSRWCRFFRPWGCSLSSSLARVLVGAALATSVVTASQDSSGWPTQVRTWVEGNQSRIIGELVQLLSIRNVAANRDDIRRNAAHLQGLFARRGFRSELLETDGNPLVFAELRVPTATRTLLLYCHYDGQPVDAKGWKQKDPFTPMFRAGGLDAAEVPNAMASARFDH